MGKDAGLFSILVLTGATTQEMADNASAQVKPDLVLADVNQLPAWLEQLELVPA
ncbi:MAG: hypothetical protein EYC68_03685, partial [Chloroflexota bacterium]